MNLRRDSEMICRASAGLAALIFIALSYSAGAQQIWFSPPDNLPRGPTLMNEDFSRLWDAAPEWSNAARDVAVFGMNPYYASVGSEESIKKIAAFLSQRGIALNVGMQSLPVEEDCGKGVEGMTRAGVPGRIARRLKGFGIDVQYFSLDSPLAYGHIYKGRQACKYSIQDVAHRLAGTIRDLRAAYPNAKIVDYEGPTDEPLAQWKVTLNEWLTAYRAETGTPLDAMGMDTSLGRPWREAAGPTIDILHQHGTKAGIFIDAHGGPGVTDESWVAEAKQYAIAIQAERLPLDFVVIASWMLHPWRNVPESDPLTLTAFVDWYARNVAGKK